MFSYMNTHLRSHESGQTMAEYAVVLAVITVGVIAVLGLLTTSIQGALNSIVNVL